MSVDRVLLASPRGFCAGVEMSVKALAWMVETFGPPVYCYHDIVHNQRVVDRFVRAGVRFVDDIDEVKPGMPLMLSAHGSAPELIERAKARTPIVVDAVCPLVTKVHSEVRNRAQLGYRIVYVGHQGHDEEVGTTARAPEAITVVDDVDDLPAALDAPVALLSQTTLSATQYDAIEQAARERYGEVWTPRTSDRCFATTNRQAAVAAIAPRCDHMIIVGSADSSNTRAMAEVAVEAGCLDVQRVNSRTELTGEFHGTVGVSSGASAPEESVREILVWLLDGDLDLVELAAHVNEDEMFPAPRDLRRLAATMPGAPDYGFVTDPAVPASAILRRL